MLQQTVSSRFGAFPSCIVLSCLLFSFPIQAKRTAYDLLDRQIKEAETRQERRTSWNNKLHNPKRKEREQTNSRHFVPTPKHITRQNKARISRPSEQLLTAQPLSANRLSFATAKMVSAFLIAHLPLVFSSFFFAGTRGHQAGLARTQSGLVRPDVVLSSRDLKTA